VTLSGGAPTYCALLNIPNTQSCSGSVQQAARCPHSAQHPFGYLPHLGAGGARRRRGRAQQVGKAAAQARRQAPVAALAWLQRGQLVLAVAQHLLPPSALPSCTRSQASSLNS